MTETGENKWMITEDNGGPSPVANHPAHHQPTITACLRYLITVPYHNNSSLWVSVVNVELIMAFNTGVTEFCNLPQTINQHITNCVNFHSLLCCLLQWQIFKLVDTIIYAEKVLNPGLREHTWFCGFIKCNLSVNLSE